ncbi:MAG: glycosyltransferase family 2 protein [Chloroflexota bacterium]|nr:glycosyltransferase family 2 protein [Chloroflexota bacterium]
MGEEGVTLSVIIVSWNTRELLRRCLASLEAGRGDLALEVIVVDNGSHDGTPEMVRDEFPQVMLLEPGINLGFAGGNNWGLSQATGQWLLLLNPDTEVIGDALSTLVSFLQMHPSIGAVGPQIFYANSSRQITCHRFPSPFTLFFASTPLHPYIRPALRWYYMEDQPIDQPHPVDWLSGAALLVRREVYEMVGGFDERFFMYFEETDWQRRIKAAGWSVWYLPDATIRHHEDASSGQVVALRHIRFNQSRLYYTEKWHGTRLAALLRFWLLFLFMVEWLKEAAKWLLGHKRPLRAERIREYGQLLRSFFHLPHAGSVPNG